MIIPFHPKETGVKKLGLMRWHFLYKDTNGGWNIPM